MIVITARNVEEIIPKAFKKLGKVGINRNSRNGDVVVFPEPVCSVYNKPCERVIFDPVRDANPFFHFFESLWMLHGRRDVDFVSKFNGNIKNYSDDGKNFHAAYGYRWRYHFEFDQIEKVVECLKKNPTDRRVVLSMWDAQADLDKEGKDFPCNLQAIFSITHEGVLDMMVTNRSNDMVWGCYGANAVHFSFLQEYIAASIGCPVGVYRQVSNNLHIYLDTKDKIEYYSPLKNYGDQSVESFSLLNSSETIQEFNHDLIRFFDNDQIPQTYNTKFFSTVVLPMWYSYKAFKNKESNTRIEEAVAIINQCEATDWKKACGEWLTRRIK